MQKLPRRVMDEDPETAQQHGRPARSTDPEPTQAPRTRDVPVEGTRRTRLADERTYLAWWRTGFAAFAVSLGAGKIVPSLTKEPRWPYTILGAGFALLGLALVGYGLMRQRQVEAAITRGAFVPPNEIVIAVLAAASMLLGVALLVLVVVS
jgi:putative membrane protein